MVQKMLHVVMYPWFAYGHMIPYMNLANEFAKKGHKITYVLPKTAKLRLQPLILHPNLINLHSIDVPHVPPLPVGTENVTDVPDLSLHEYLAIAFDRTRPEFELIISGLVVAPDVVFYDFAYWVPQVATRLDIKFKAVCYSVVSADCANISKHYGRSVNSVVINGSESKILKSKTSSQDGPSLPKSSLEVQESGDYPVGEGLFIFNRVKTVLHTSDAIAFRTCREVEGDDCNDISSEYKKAVLLCGPLISGGKTESLELEPKWAKWLARFELGSALFCAVGSQFSFDKAQFQEILLGFEMTKMPFFLALRPPEGCATIEEACPEGFEERVKGKGVVTGKWVQQQLILAHSSVGCFVNHCGFGTMWESLLSKNQIVLIPQLDDQKLNAKILVNKLKVGVEVKRANNEWISKENLCETILCVMDEKSEIGGFVRKNHQLFRDKLSAPGFMDDYIDKFIIDIQNLVD